jgi:FAM192A/Fyv6, N-terminal domain
VTAVAALQRVAPKAPGSTERWRVTFKTPLVTLFSTVHVCLLAMTTIGFVSTSVLESKDGIDFSDEKRVESEETKDAERRAAEAARQPLWEQLQERQDKKAEDFEAVRKSIFAPPRGLDEEDVDFLEGVEAARRAAKAKKHDWETQEVEAFSLARANQTVALAAAADGAGSSSSSSSSAPVLASRPKPAAAAPAEPAVLIVKKRRKEDDSSKKHKKKKKSKKSADEAGLTGLLAYGEDYSLDG